MGGALVALGLLGECRWDEDSAYAPRRIGVYLRTDSLLWWVPEGGGPVRLPYKVRSIVPADKEMVALAWGGDTVYFFSAGALSARRSSPIAGGVLALASVAVGKSLYIYGVGSESGWLGWSPRPSAPLEETPAIPTLRGQRVVSAPSFVGIGDGKELRCMRPGEKTAFWQGTLPGPIEALWAEPPTTLAGVWRGRDTVYAFSALPQAGVVQIDTARPARYRLRVASPYLQKNFGTEYLGTLSLLWEGRLEEGGLPQVQSIAADFLGGWGYVAQRDTVWLYRLPEGVERRQPLLTGVYAREIEVVGVYRYGSAEITMR